MRSFPDVWNGPHRTKKGTCPSRVVVSLGSSLALISSSPPKLIWTSCIQLGNSEAAQKDGMIKRRRTIGDIEKIEIVILI